MENKTKFVIIGIIFVVIMTVVGIMYDNLSKAYVDENEKIAQEVNDTEVIEMIDFTVFDENKNQVKLSEFRGKPIVLNFWATWCGYCVQEFPYFENTYNKYGDDVEFLMINLTDGESETLDSAKEFVEDKGYTFPVYYDLNLEASAVYEAYSIPLTVVIDKDGNVVRYRSGAITEEILEKYITDTLEVE